MSDLKPHKAGYMKPPKHGQFKKGQSGNPKGRPKKPEDLFTVLQKVLARKVTVAGQDRKISIREALVRRLRERTLAGEKRAIALQQKILEQAAAAAPDHGTTIDINELKRRMAETFGLLKTQKNEEEPSDGE